MTPFLQYVAQDLIAKHPEGLQNIAIVFPNKRASLFLNQALYAEAQHPIWSPSYLTISELFRSHSALTVPDECYLIFKLYNIFCEKTGSTETLDHFYSWGQLLLSDFDDIDKNMADADKLFINLEAWQELKDFSFLNETQRESLNQFFGKVLEETTMQKHFRDLWKHLGDIYNAFRQSLKEENHAYEGMLYRQVAEQESKQFDYDKYVFVGFNLLQKVEQELFKQLKEEGRAIFYWDYDTYYMEGHNEAGKYIKRYLEVFPNELSNTRISTGLHSTDIYANMAQKKNITYISAPTENIQARYVSEWLKTLGDKMNSSKTAIVLSNENLLETVIHCLPEEVQNVNVTTGYPLASTPISNMVNILFELYLNGRIQDTEKYRLKYVKQILNHPYSKYLSPDCRTLSHELSAQHLYFPTRTQLTEGYDENIRLLFTDLDDKETSHTLLSWMAAIVKAVAINANEEYEDLRNESIFRMYTLLHRLDDLMIVNPSAVPTPEPIDPVTGKQVVSTFILQQLLRQVILSTSIPFHGEPLLGLQIMGVLETRNLDFEDVLVLSCNEGNLPKKVNDASFIPHSLRVGYELTTVENKVAIYSYYFHSLLQRTCNITLTYNDATDASGHHEMSRFMLQMLVEHPYASEIHQKTLRSGQSVQRLLPQVVEKDDKIMESLSHCKRLSPSAINRYLRCPLQFYYNTVCKLYESDTDEMEEMDNRTFGNIFHRSAELLYQDCTQNSKNMVTAEMIDALIKDPTKIDRTIDRAFAEQIFKVKDSPNYVPQLNGLQLLNKKVVHLYLERMLRYDRRLTPFRILALEKNFYHNISFSINGEERTITIGGQVDRLDEVFENNQSIIRVVDYKTGAPLNSLPSSTEEIFSSENVDKKHTAYYLQAFLYASIIHHDPNVNPQASPVAPALFFLRQTSSEDYNPILKFAKSKELINDIQVIEDEFNERLSSLLIEIFSREIPFTPTTDTSRCTNCPYQDICK